MEVPRTGQDTDVAGVAMRRVAWRLRMGDHVGARQLDVGLVVL